LAHTVTIYSLHTYVICTRESGEIFFTYQHCQKDLRFHNIKYPQKGGGATLSSAHENSLEVK